MSLSVSLSLSVDTAPTAGQSPTAKPVKTEDHPALSCVFSCLKNVYKIKTWNSSSSGDDVSATAILFILLEKKMTNFGFYFVVYNEKFNDNMGLFWRETEKEAVPVIRACADSRCMKSFNIQDVVNKAPCSRADSGGSGKWATGGFGRYRC